MGCGLLQNIFNEFQKHLWTASGLFGVSSWGFWYHGPLFRWTPTSIYLFVTRFNECGVKYAWFPTQLDQGWKPRKKLWEFKMYNKIRVRHLKISTNVFFFFVLNKTFLRLYLYEDGLVRFATEEYVENPESLANPFIHLTNYAINRNNQTTGQQQGNISQLILK